MDDQLVLPAATQQDEVVLATGSISGAIATTKNDDDDELDFDDYDDIESDDAAASASGTASSSSVMQSNAASASAAPSKPKKRKKQQPGMSILKTERNRLSKTLDGLRKKREARLHVAAGGKKRPTTTVCGLLMDSMINFYEGVIRNYDAQYNQYMN